MHQTPVVSLNADPDEIICNLKMGFHSRSVEQMVKRYSRTATESGLVQIDGAKRETICRKIS